MGAVCLILAGTGHLAVAQGIWGDEDPDHHHHGNSVYRGEQQPDPFVHQPGHQGYVDYPGHKDYPGHPGQHQGYPDHPGQHQGYPDHPGHPPQPLDHLDEVADQKVSGDYEDQFDDVPEATLAFQKKLHVAAESVDQDSLVEEKEYSKEDEEKFPTKPEYKHKYASEEDGLDLVETEWQLKDHLPSLHPHLLPSHLQQPFVANFIYSDGPLYFGGPPLVHGLYDGPVPEAKVPAAQGREGYSFSPATKSAIYSGYNNRYNYNGYNSYNGLNSFTGHNSNIGYNNYNGYNVHNAYRSINKGRVNHSHDNKLKGYGKHNSGFGYGGNKYYTGYGDKYSTGYGYGDKYSTGYGYGDKYSTGYGYGDKYSTGYGHGDYGFGYDDKYNLGYGYANNYN